MKSKRNSAGNISFATISEVSVLLRKREISPVELTEHFLGRIEKYQPALNAFISVTRDRALADARASELRHKRKKPLGPLDGIPIALKDNIWTAGILTTAGSRILRNFVPERDATVAARLKNAGAVLLGKTNLHEFAYGVSTENPHYGTAHNPWDASRSSGGSSGGSAAAVAAGLCVASLGTDTGGSIRIPSSLCGTIGLKPTFGRVSCYGTVPLAPSFDHVGPIARTVADAAILLAAIAGYDSNDPTTQFQPKLKALRIRQQISAQSKSRRRMDPAMRLGWPREYFFDRIDPEIRTTIEAARRTFESVGATIEEISLPHVSDGDEPSTVIALAEATHFHRQSGWFSARAAEYGDDVRKRLELGAEVRAADYLAAKEACLRVRREFDAALENVDAILAPATPIAAQSIGTKMVTIDSKEEPIRGALIRLNRPANLTGHPAICVPCGLTRSGMPVGLQIIGRYWDEPGLLAIAAHFESTQPALRPPAF
ncbi:MAG TPA: amidase [Candidatus Acidoferrales bacterium]|nr:amidase [Candidatus Acidoferrales bacterium]